MYGEGFHLADYLAVMLYLGAVFGVWGTGLEVDNPDSLGGLDDAVGTQHLAMEGDFRLAAGGVGGVEEACGVGVGEEIGDELSVER